MAVSTVMLRELHRIHSQLSDLRGRLARGPRRVQAHQANLHQQQEVLARAQENVRQTLLLVDRKQLELKTGENKILDSRAKLNACSSNKEYQLLLEQIAAAEMANSVLADEILEAMEQGDQFEAAVGEAKTQVAAIEAELEKCRQAVAAEAQLIQVDMERLEAELAAAEQEVPAEIKAEYDRIIGSKGADGMAQAEDGVCQGCGYQITLNRQPNGLASLGFSITRQVKTYLPLALFGVMKMSERVPMTRTGFDKLKAELEHLSNEEMPKIEKRIAAARAEGDLSENAEYHGARESQGMLQAKINLLKDKLSRADIIDMSTLPKDQVVFGVTVKVKDLDFGDTEEFTLVGAGDEDYDVGKILITSPLGQGLLGKKVGEQVAIEVPAGTNRFEILELRFEDA